MYPKTLSFLSVLSFLNRLLSLSGTLRISLSFSFLSFLPFSCHFFRDLVIFTFSVALSDIYLCDTYVAQRHTVALRWSGNTELLRNVSWVARILPATHLCYAHTLSSSELVGGPKLWQLCLIVRANFTVREYPTNGCWAARILRYSVVNSIQRPPSDSVGSTRHDPRAW